MAERATVFRSTSQPTVSANWRINGSRPILVVLGRDRMGDAECGFVLGGAVADPAPAAAFFACAGSPRRCRLQARRSNSAGFSFGFAGREGLLTLSFKPMLIRRGRSYRSQKSGAHRCSNLLSCDGRDRPAPRTPGIEPAPAAFPESCRAVSASGRRGCDPGGAARGQEEADN